MTYSDGITLKKVKKAVEADAVKYDPGFKKLSKERKAEITEMFAIPPSSERFTEIIDGLDFDHDSSEWDRKEILLLERDVLGRAISGSLHEVFRSFFSGGPMVTPLSEVPNLNENSRIKVEAIIKSKIKKSKTQ